LCQWQAFQLPLVDTDTAVLDASAPLSSVLLYHNIPIRGRLKPLMFSFVFFC
jgi:hypothetical protein